MCVCVDITKRNSIQRYVPINVQLWLKYGGLNMFMDSTLGLWNGYKP